MLFSVHYINKEHISSFKIKYVPSADFYEIRNTDTVKLAFCDGTLIVATVTLQEPYFPKHVFSYINLGNLVLFL